MYYYGVYGTRKDNGVEETIRTFDCSMNLTDSEAREAALEYELIVRRDPKYSASRVCRRLLSMK